MKTNSTTVNLHQLLKTTDQKKKMKYLFQNLSIFRCKITEQLSVFFHIPPFYVFRQAFELLLSYFYHFDCLYYLIFSLFSWSSSFSLSRFSCVKYSFRQSIIFHHHYKTKPPPLVLLLFPLKAYISAALQMFQILWFLSFFLIILRNHI